MDRTAILVVGDHAYAAWSTTIEPNVPLAKAGLVTPLSPGSGILSWTAVARSSGGSAFVYAKTEADALLAREALEQAAAATPGFRIVSADEMLRHGADAEAWFGLEAEPGFAFGVAAAGAISHAAADRGVGGYLASHPSPAFVAYGRGVRSRVRIARMRQVDVAPTVASLLGLTLSAADGRALANALDPAAADLTQEGAHDR
jgi:hypothetical protein